jgi:hypothetical protein
MRIEFGWVCAALLLAGCVHHEPPIIAPPTPEKKKPPETYITPALGPVGRVEMVNNEGRFVVLSFPPGKLPSPGQRWRIHHRGLKIGLVKITGPQRQLDTVADIIEGEANIGDEASPE